MSVRDTEGHANVGRPGGISPTSTTPTVAEVPHSADAPIATNRHQ